MIKMDSHPPSPLSEEGGANGSAAGVASIWCDGSRKNADIENATHARIGRLKWHSRRALLELDIVLERFWAQQGDDLDETSATVLTRLLALEDHDLWDLVSGKVSISDPALIGFIGMLRGLTASAPRAN